MMKRLATIALVLVAGSTAYAAPKYNRKTIDIKVDQDQKVEKITPNENMKKEKAAPQVTADQFFRVEGEVANIRSAQIEEYMNLIEETDDDDPEKPDLYFRLAELFAQKQRYFHFRAMELYPKIDKAKSAGEKNKLKKEQQGYFDAEKKELLNAVKVYKAIADNPKFRNYGRMDEALFYYAYTLQQAKYADQARIIFKRLIKDYPNSRFIPDAYLAFAEYYFQQNNLESAEKFYDKVLEFPKSAVYNYALYMKGWVYYNQAFPKKSLEVWYEVAQKTKGSKKEKDLNRASKKDFVRAYADVGAADKAYAAFKRVDESYAFEMLGFLGEYYLAQGKADKTIFVFQQMMRERPKDERVCEWQYTVVRAVMTVGSNDQKIAEVERLAKLYRFLADNKTIKPAALSECRENAQTTVAFQAKIWHIEGLKTLNYDILANADRMYHAYVTYFPDAEDRGEMQMYYAELLWKRAEGETVPGKAKIIATAGVDALKDLAVRYLELKPRARPDWFTVGPRIRANPDFVSMAPESVDDLAARRVWVEWTILRQYQAIYAEALLGMRDVNYVIAIDTRYLGEAAMKNDDREALGLAIKFFNSYLRATLNAKDVRTAYNILNQYRLLAEAVVTRGWNDVALEVANYIKYYGHVSFRMNLAFITETVAYDLCALCEHADRLKSPVEDKLLRTFLEVDQPASEGEVQETGLRGVRKAQVKLATFYLVNGREDMARTVFEDMAAERPERLTSIKEELMAVESKDFWEVIDRGTNFDYLPPDQKAALSTFFGWFDAPDRVAAAGKSRTLRPKRPTFIPG